MPKTTTTVKAGTFPNGDRLNLTIELRDITREDPKRTVSGDTVSRYVELAITGERFEYRHRDPSSAGQNLGDLRDLVADEGAELNYPREDLREVLRIWERWHLNGMTAGCQHQLRDGWHKRPIDPRKPLDTYGRHYEGQQSATWNMLAWVTEREHPEGLLSRPCPECGYKYGSAWLLDPLPVEVAETLARVFEFELPAELATLLAVSGTVTA